MVLLIFPSGLLVVLFFLSALQYRSHPKEWILDIVAGCIILGFFALGVYVILKTPDSTIPIVMLVGSALASGAYYFGKKHFND